MDKRAASVAPVKAAPLPEIDRLQREINGCRGDLAASITEAERRVRHLRLAQYKQAVGIGLAVLVLLFLRHRHHQKIKARLKACQKLSRRQRAGL
jgi:hypothetical protein